MGIVGFLAAVSGILLSAQIMAGAPANRRTDTILRSDGLFTSTNGVNPDGTQWTTLYEGPAGAASPVWSRTVSDFLGRTLTTARPGFNGATLTTSNTYNTAGHLIRTQSSSAGGVYAAALYAYDSLGDQTLAAQDLDLDGQIDLAGPDRVSESHTSYQSHSSHWWQVHTSIIYPHDSSATPLTNSISRTRLTGLGSSSAHGLLTSESCSLDLLGNETVSRTYVDRDARTVTQVTDTPDSTLDAIQISVNGLAQRSISPTGVTNSFAHDALGRPISLTDGRGNTSRTHYDPVGRVDWTADAANATNSFAYDTLTGRRVTTIDPLGQSTHTAYDTEGRVIATWGATYPVAYEYDSFGRRIAMATTRAPAHESVNLLTLLPAGVHLSHTSHSSYPASLDTTRWLYHEPTGLLTNKLYADGRGPTYTYTPDGKLATRTWARGVTTAYAYDACCGALTNIVYSDATPTVAFQYDRLGRQKVAQTFLSAHHYAYDPATLALTAETIIAGVETNVLSRTQDSLGRSSGLALGADYAVGYGYDAVGRVAGLVATNAGVAVADVRYAYVPGAYVLSGWTNGVSETTVIRNYEGNRDLLTRVRNLGGQTVISQFDYQNDALGRRTRRLDTLAGMPNSLTNSFGYNTRSEVVAALMGTNEYGYAFDPIGNRLTSTNSGESFSYTANELNQYLQIVDGGTCNLGFDADGNITNDGRRAFMWDGENRLLAVEPLAPTGGARRIRCAYDHMSRRVEKAVDVWNGSDWVATATNRFTWDGWLLVRESGAQATGVATNWNVWGLDLSGSFQGAGGIGGLICRTAGDGVIHYYFMDANGNVSDVTDASGTNILARYLPGPFGEPRLVSGTLSSNPWQFSSKYWDSETDLGYWGYRYYDPITGRWLSRDPIEEEGGANLLVFLLNAPTYLVDSDGRVPVRWGPNFPIENTEPNDTHTPATNVDDCRCCKATKCRWTGKISGNMLIPIFVGGWANISFSAQGTSVECPGYLWTASAKGRRWIPGGGLAVGWIKGSVDINMDAPCEWPIGEKDIGTISWVGVGGSVGVPVSLSWTVGTAGTLTGQDWFGIGGINAFIGGGAFMVEFPVKREKWCRQ